MFDDLEVNLTLPHERGMTTVWVSGEPFADGTPYRRIAPKRWEVCDLPTFLTSVTTEMPGRSRGAAGPAGRLSGS